jgi:hypothetical protein
LALLLLIVHTLLFIAGLALLGQLLVGVFNWGRRNENVIYQLFALIGRPVVRVARWITPRQVLDQHVPVVAFLLCAFGYLTVGFYQRSVCLERLDQPGCEKWAQARSR